jgi:hypothetical protein
MASYLLGRLSAQEHGLLEEALEAAIRAVTGQAS